MPPLDILTFFDGKLRLTTHHYASRTESILMHVPSMRQVTIRQGSETAVASRLEDGDRLGFIAPENLYAELATEFGEVKIVEKMGESN